MNYQTREKITNIRTAIQNGATAEEIDKSYFKTKTIKITFLSRNKNYFDPEELKYLKFNPETNSLTELEVPKIDTPNKITKSKKVRNDEETETNNLTKVEVVRNIEDIEEIEVAEVKTEVAKIDTPNNLTMLENNFFKDENNLKSLIEMVKKYRNQNENLIEVIEAGMVNIPLEAKELELNAILSVRTNKEIYAKIVEMAQKNKAGKGEFLTYILWDFLKRNS